MNAGRRLYSIKDLEYHCGIKAHTIRMWEKRYNILSPGRSDSNIRYYSEEDLKKLISVSTLNRNGVKISNIARLKNTELQQAMMKISSCEENINKDRRQSALLAPALQFNEVTFRKELQKIINSSGLENAYINVLYPLKQKARSLWITGCLSKSQDNFIGYVIRDLIAATEVQLQVQDIKENALIVNMGDSDAENNLLFLKYLLRKRGFDVVYSTDRPSDTEIKNIHTVKPFSILAVNVPASEDENILNEFCNSITGKLGLKKMLVLGRFEQSDDRLNENTVTACTPKAMAEWADSLCGKV